MARTAGQWLNARSGFIVLLAALLPSCAPGPRAPGALGRSVVRLEKALTERIGRATQGATAAVSLVDVESGLRLGIHDEVKLGEAASARVPVLLEVFRQIDRASLRLDELVTVNDRVTRPDGTTHTILPSEDSDTTLYRLIGGQLPVRELVRALIVSSSNLATNSLVQRITPAALQITVKELQATGTAEGLARALELIARCKMHSKQSCKEMQRTLGDHKPSEEFAAGSPGMPISHLSGQNGTLHYEAGIFFPPGQKPYVLVIATDGFAQATDAARMRADLARLVASSLTERAIAIPLR